MTSVGVLICGAKRCGDHLAMFSRAAADHGGAAHLPLGEPQLLGGAHHRLEVVDAVVADRGLEAVRVADRSSSRRSRRSWRRQCPCAARRRTAASPTALKTASRSHHHLAAPVLRDLVDELLAEAGRAARVRRGDDPALRRPQLRVPARRPRVLPRALRPAVDEEHDRILLRGIEVAAA